MPRTRKEAPDVELEPVVGNERSQMIREWDAKEPEYKHAFKLLDSTERELSRGHYEPVTDEDGNRVQDDYQMLCRVDKKTWTRKRELPEKRSLKQVESINSDQGQPFTDGDSFTKFRDPKKVPRKKE